MKPDFYADPQLALKTHFSKINTNTRYKNFCQTHPTAGDFDQFFSWKEETECPNYSFVNGAVTSSNKSCINNNNFWENYCNLDGYSFENTFKYIFHKFKKGIYIRILNGKLDKFLPFSNINYRNNIDPEKISTPHFDNVSSCINSIYSDSSYRKPKLHDDYSCWVFNNGIVRFEYPVSEGDSGCVQMRDMFRELCENRNVPDMEFFVNRRDFPLLRKDLTEAYFQLYPPNTSIKECYIRKSFLPILSMNGNDDYADILIPTWDDWSRVRSIEDGKFFVKGARDYRYNLNTDFDSKKNVFIFRGASTGLEVNYKNPRIATVLFAKSNKHLPIDAGITKWNMRPRIKWENEKLCFDTFSQNLKTQVGTVDEMSPEEQSNYKFIISIPGHSFAYRFSLELSFNSVILLVKGENTIWYMSKLKEWEHYIPIKADLSNLEECIRWCLDNKEKCKEIANNAYEFYKTYLSKQSILDYLQNLLIDLKKFNGEYNLFPKSKLQKQLDYYTTLYPRDKLYSQLSLNQSYNKIKENTFRTIYENGMYICKKINGDDLRVEAELLHEIYFYDNVINTDFKLNYCKLISYNSQEAYYTKLRGNSLLDYLNSKSFSFEVFVKILYKISENMYKFQTKCTSFMHNDLYPWNIILYCDNVYIIDFGKSVYMSKDRIFTLEKDEISSIHDIITILISSLSIITGKYIPNDKVYFIHKLFSFVNNSGFTKNKQLTNLKHIKQFVNHVKKYDVMNYIPKHELERLTPIDFCNFLCTTFSNHNLKPLVSNYKINFEKLTCKYKKQFDKFISENKNYKTILELDKFEEYINVNYKETSLIQLGNLRIKLRNFVVVRLFGGYDFGNVKVEDIFKKLIKVNTEIFYRN